jgi:branched-chain amino acid transport system substrate-binding protein
VLFRSKCILVDDACNPVNGLAAVKKLIYDDEVFLIFGGNCTSVVLAAKPILEKTGTPFFVQGANHDSIVEPVVKNMFNSGFTSSIAVKSEVDFAMNIPNVKRVGVIRHTDEWAMALYKPALTQLKEKYNLVPVVDVVTERDAADVSPQVLKLKEAKVDVVLALVYVVPTTTFLRDAYKLGLDVPIMGSTATDPTQQYRSLKNMAPLKKYFSPFWLKYTLDHPKVKVYEELFKKHYPREPWDSTAIYITGGALVIIDALQKCGRDLTQEKFIEVLETNYKNWEPERYIGASPLTFSKTRHYGMDRLSLCTIATGQMEVVNTYQDYEKLMKK